MGHVLLMVPHIDAAFTFYPDLLGFASATSCALRLSLFPPRQPAAPQPGACRGPEERHAPPDDRTQFLRHDVGQGYDIALGGKDLVAVKLGHSNDLMTSFYQRTPSDILVECGWGGRDVDDATWQSQEMTTVGSFWGHQQLADPPPPSTAPPPLMATPVRRDPFR
jgi:catechol 2,3-dioxygenase-like lactoylglutathione lyase family enzyme